MSALVTISLVLASLGVVLGSEPIDYPVRDIPQDSEKFRKILFEVASQDLQARSRKGQRLKITQHIEGTLYLAEMHRFSSEVVGGRVLTDRSMKLIAADLVHEKRLADGSSLTTILEDTGKIYEYVSVLGAKNSVPLYRQPDAAKAMTAADFVRRLEAGETFTIQMGTTEKRCQTCGGFGRVTDESRRRRSQDGKTECKACRGKGMIETPSTYRIKW